MFLSRKKTPRYGISLDVGTASVSGALFSFEQNADGSAKPYVHEVYRSLVDMSVGAHAHDLSRHALRGIREIISKALKKAPSAPDTFVVGLAAPFYISRTVKIKNHRADPSSVITEEEVEKVMEEAEKEVLGAFNLHDADQAYFFSRVPLKVLVNGYRLPAIFGKTGKTLEVLTRFEAMNVRFKEKVFESINTSRPSVHIYITSMPTASFYTLQAVTDVRDGLIFIDIGGEVTEMSVISDGTLEKIVSLPAGSGSIIRKIAELMNAPFAEALFAVKRFNEGTLETALVPKIEALVEEAVSKWRFLMFREIEEVYKSGVSPSKIILSGGGSLLLKYKKSFLGNMFKNPGQRNVVVSILRPDALQERFENASYFLGPEDFGLACLSLLPFNAAVHGDPGVFDTYGSNSKIITKHSSYV